MKSVGFSWATAVLLLLTHAAGATEALSDPIPQQIGKGDMVVEAVEFVHLPRTTDSTDIGANEAFARIQYMKPIGDGSGRLVINDLRGLLYVTNAGGQQPVVYIDLRSQNVGFDDSMFPNETGLAGFAFHPDFADRKKPGYGKFYTAYSTPSDSGVADYLEDDAASHESVIREWTADDHSANVFSGSSREVFRIGQFAPNHNIGAIAFNRHIKRGAFDYDMLYFSLGDGGTANDPRDFGQSITEPMSSIVRIDPLGGNAKRGYGIPPDNPFVGHDNAAAETWAFGLRHPQHFSWDTDGRMFITDIGQNHIEEVNLGFAGANYGWRLREGNFAFMIAGEQVGPVYPLPSPDTDRLTYPIAEYDHDEGNAVSSGFVYRGSDIPALVGKYLFSDLVRGRIFYIDTDTLNPGEPAEITELRVSIDGKERQLTDVAGFANTYNPGTLRVDLRLGIDAEGELYLLTKGDGWVRKLSKLQRGSAALNTR